jgi:glycosyltransferase involved in cell wall biosynthesis
VRVLMAVMWDLSNDARVRREATALAAVGHDVLVVGFDYSVDRPTRRREGGVSFHALPFPPRGTSQARRLLGAAVFWARAAREIVAADADVFHSHNLHLVVPCMIAARRCRAKLVYDAHEIVTGTGARLKRALARPSERFVWKRADAVISTNATRARYLEQLHGGEPPVVLGNYPDEPPALSPVDLRASLTIPSDAPILIYQGGFYFDTRCFDTVAEALRGLPGWHWVLVGFGSPQTIERLRKTLQDHGVDDRSHVLPPVPAEELLHITAGADVGVVPLRATELNTYFGDTNKLFEYLVAGLAVVGSDFPEERRAILENPVGPVGAVFDPDKPESVATAISQVAEDLPTLRQRAADVGRRFYSWRTERVKLLELYDRLETARSNGTVGPLDAPSLG